MRQRDAHGAVVGVGGEGLGVEGHAGRRLERGERAPGVASGDPDQVLAGVVGQGEPAGQASLLDDGGVDDLADLVVGERLESDEDRAGEQWRDDAERRVLRRGGHEDDEPVLHTGQKTVLLRLGEPVELVEEQHRLAVVEIALAAGLVHDLADVLDARGHAGARRSGGWRRWRRGGQGGLPGSRRSPDDRRERTGGAAGPFDQPAQRAAGPEHVGLAADLVERPRAHPDRERREGGVDVRRAARHAFVACGGEQVRRVTHRRPA